ncbi:MAG: hypothetical protein WCS96_02115 [Victivallales bacterium]
MADDKKVIIGSNGGAPVKPGDMTRITSAVKMGAGDDDSIATATIPRMKVKANVASDSVETAAVNKEEIKAKLGGDGPKKATIRLKPAAAAGEEVESATVPLQASAAAPKTVVASAPAPLPAQATAVPKFTSEASSEEDETVKIQKPRPVSNTAVPGVKQTIKLRPSSNTPAPMSGSDSNAGFIPPPPPPQPATAQAGLSGASEAKRTIRLVPKKADATSGGEQQVSTAARPSAPTIKLEEPSPVSAGSSAARSALTIKLPPAEGETDAAAPKRTLKLKSTRPEATVATPHPAPATPIPASPALASATDAEVPVSAGEGQIIPPTIEKAARKEGKQEPSMIFTIAACIAFFVMAYFAWMLVGQYCNNHMDSKISVPGLSGKVK